jgi:hypothetical protein
MGVSGHTGLPAAAAAEAVRNMLEPLLLPSLPAKAVRALATAADMGGGGDEADDDEDDRDMVCGENIVELDMGVVKVRCMCCGVCA